MSFSPGLTHHLLKDRVPDTCWPLLLGHGRERGRKGREEANKKVRFVPANLLECGELALRSTEGLWEAVQDPRLSLPRGGGGSHSCER